MDKVKVSVNEQDIEQGGVTDRKCPISKSVTRIINEDVFVKTTYIGASGYLFFHLSSTGTPQYTVPLPKEATNFMILYDLEIDVAPLEFEVEIPSFYLRKNEETI